MLLDLEPTQPAIQWVPQVLSIGVKRSGCVADNSLPSSADVKNSGGIPHNSVVRCHAGELN
jgi:hypothetical protein